MAINKGLVLMVFMCLEYQCHAQTDIYYVFYSDGDVSAFGKNQSIRIKAKQKLNDFQYLQIGSRSSVILINQDGIPSKFDKEGIYVIKNLNKYFKSDPITSKYFKFIWEEIELKPHDRYSSNLNVVAATNRGKEEKEYPWMLCPFDSTIVVNDSVFFTWTDPKGKGFFSLFVYDYQDDWKILLKKEVSSTFITLNTRDLGLQPGKDYAWIVSYPDSLNNKRFCNIITIPSEIWLKNYSDKLHEQEKIATEEYDQLRLAFFFLESHQFCDAKTLYQKLASVNEKDELIKKAKIFFSY
jgi:hypothetical protein